MVVCYSNIRPKFITKKCFLTPSVTHHSTEENILLRNLELIEGLNLLVRAEFYPPRTPSGRWVVLSATVDDQAEL